MKETALLMTMGTGSGKENIRERIDSLAHGILFSIENNHPKKIVFFGSDKSRTTLNCLLKQYEDKYGQSLDFYEFIEINEVDDFEKYFNGIKSKIKELDEEYRIIIDYTSGTKTMTMSASLASMVFRKQLSLVTGNRDNNIVKKGTEKFITQNLYPVYDDLMIEKVKELFNSNRFESAKSLLDDADRDNRENQYYRKLCDVYTHFDNVDYESALNLFDEEFLDEIRTKWPYLAQKFADNRNALTKMQKIDPEKIDLGKKPWKNKKYRKRCYYILASLINNAKRRFAEHKYNDAIARLYRSMELIAQIRLREKYNTSTSDIDLEYLKKRGIGDEYISVLEKRKSEISDKIKIGLIDDYTLLYHLGDELGKFSPEYDSELFNCSEYRNHSILAHGLQYQTSDDYRRFEELVMEAANMLVDDLDLFLNETEFPKFNIN